MSKANIFSDSWIMFKRCMLISSRNPETMIMAIVTPFFLMLLFGTLFANIVDIGDYSYVDFIVPGIILQAVAQASQYTAINITNDMTNGIIDRFRSMPVSKAAVLVGHALTSVVRNTLTTVIIIGTAFLVGFRPSGGFVNWLMAAGILLLFIIAISWIAVLCGLISKVPESSAGLMFPLFILPYISSGFAPTDTMPRWLGVFAEHQPLTPVIDSTRALMLDLPADGSIWLALAWCLGIIAVAFAAAVHVYRRKLT